MSSLKTAQRLYERCREAGDKSAHFIPYRVADSSFYGRINALRSSSLILFPFLAASRLLTLHFSYHDIGVRALCLILPETSGKLH